MKDAIEQLLHEPRPRPLVRATQAGCGHWMPIAHVPREAPEDGGESGGEKGGEKPVAMSPLIPSVPPVEQKPD